MPPFESDGFPSGLAALFPRADVYQTVLVGSMGWLGVLRMFSGCSLRMHVERTDGERMENRVPHVGVKVSEGTIGR